MYLMLALAALLHLGQGQFVSDECCCGTGNWQLNLNTGRCYLKLEGTGYNWNEYVAACRSFGDGSDAVSIEDANENEAVYEIGGRSYIYIGGDCQGNGRSFRWADGSPFYYTKWAPGEPSNSFGNEECIVMADGIHGRRDNWNDIACRDRHTGVCKKAAKTGNNCQLC